MRDDASVIFSSFLVYKSAGIINEVLSISFLPVFFFRDVAPAKRIVFLHIRTIELISAGLPTSLNILLMFGRPVLFTTDSQLINFHPWEPRHGVFQWLKVANWNNEEA